MRQVLRAGALGRPRGMGWGGRREVGLGWGTHVNPWLLHVNVWQKPLQYCKVISLQRIKINGKKKKTPTPENQGVFLLLYSSCVSTCSTAQSMSQMFIYIIQLCKPFIIHIQPEDSQLCTYNSVLNIQISNISITMHSYSLEFLPILTISNSLK